MKPILSVSKTALQQFRTVLSNNKGQAIQIGLKSGGCSGFEYKINPVTQPVPKGDEAFQLEGVNFQVCGKSMMYLLGTRVDWVSDIMGSRFTFDNPSAQNTCGCGSSFNPKF